MSEKIVRELRGGKYTVMKQDIGSCKGCSFKNNCGWDTHDACYDLGLKYVFVPYEEPTKEDKMEDVSSGIKYDSDKLQYSLIPAYALEAVAKNLTEGLKKYQERDNWKKVQGAQQRYLDALYRHLEAHRKGELYDTESSDPSMLHMAAVAVNAMFLLEFLLNPELKGE